MLASILAVDQHLTSRVSRMVIEPHDVLADILQAGPGGEEASAVFRLIPRLFDVPLDLAGFQRLQGPAHVLCRSVTQVLGLTQAWLPLIDEFFRPLSLHPSHPRPALLKTYPFLFHAVAWKRSQQGGNSSAYPLLAALIHQALRRAQEEISLAEFGPTRGAETFYRYWHACDRFLQYVSPADLPPMNPVRGLLPVAVVKAAFGRAGCALGRPTLSDWNPALKEDFGRCINLLCEPRSIRPHAPPSPRAGASDRCHLLRVSGSRATYLERSHGHEALITVHAPESALEEGETAWDWATILAVPEAGDRTERRPARVAQAVALPLSLWDFSVSPSCELAAIHDSFFAQPLAEISRTELSLALATLLILHCGLDPAQVVALAASDGGIASLRLDRQRLTLLHALPDDLPARHTHRPPDLADHLPGDRIVEVPLPPLMAAVVQAYEAKRTPEEASSPYLQVETPAGLAPLTLAALEARLKHIAAGLTPARLRRTFQPLYAWAGLQPLLCAYLANRFDFNLRATAFYANLTNQELAARYALAHHRVLELLSYGRQSAPHWLVTTPSLTSVPGGRVGSRLVPRIERVEQYFCDLLARLQKLMSQAHSAVQAHNLYVVYVLLALQWATAIRPVRDPLIDRTALLGPPGWIVVGDKDNGRFRESRLVPVCATAWSLLVNLHGGVERLTQHLGRDGTPIDVGQDALFFIAGASTAKPLSPDRARRVLQAEGLPYPWRLNVPRHYWISACLERGDPLGSIEPFLGHTHQGQELWGPFSLATLTTQAEKFRGYAEGLLQALGVRVLDHPLEGQPW